MTMNLPISPSLSPGRHLFRAVPQSPGVGFRVPGSGVYAPPGGSATLAVGPRHSKSTSDLAQGGRGRYDPARLMIAPTSNVSGAALAVNRGASPPPPARPQSPRSASDLSGWLTGRPVAPTSSRPYTPAGPGQSAVWGSPLAAPRAVSPTTGTTPPPPLRQARVSQGGQQMAIGASGALPSPKRVSSMERRPPQWATATFNPVSAQGLAPPGGSLQAPAVAPRPWAMSAGGMCRTSPRRPPGSSMAAPAGAASMVPPSATPVVGRSWSQSSARLRELPQSSPRIETAFRGTSCQSLEEAAARASQTAASLNVPPKAAGVHGNGHEEAQMAQVRDSLLQHIQSVQMEISRLQAERTQKPVQQATVQVQRSVSPAATARHMVVQQFVDQRPGVVQHLELSAPAEADPAVALRAEVQEVAAQMVSLARPEGVGGAACLGAEEPSASSPPRFRAVHHAACRIQRAWKVSRWRRRFTDFSEREVGWVGSLEWLQQQNLLYGTELADAEDVRWWMQQRATAPLDREVDPWGCTKLRDHLNRMWYGRSVEDTQAAAQEVQYQEEQYPAADAQASYAAAAQYSVYEAQTLHAAAPLHQRASIGSHQGRVASHSLEPHAQRAATAGPGASRGVAASFRSPPRTERASRVTATAGGACKSTSLSPRRELPLVKADLHRPRGLVLAAPPPAMHAFASPPPTHRSTRTHAITPVSAAVAAGLRQRSPSLQAQAPPSGRLSLTVPAASVPPSPIQTSQTFAAGATPMATTHRVPTPGQMVSGNSQMPLLGTPVTSRLGSSMGTPLGAPVTAAPRRSVLV